MYIYIISLYRHTDSIIFLHFSSNMSEFCQGTASCSPDSSGWSMASHWCDTKIVRKDLAPLGQAAAWRQGVTHLPGLVMTNIAIENGHRNSWFSHEKMVDLSSSLCDSLPEGKCCLIHQVRCWNMLKSLKNSHGNVVQWSNLRLWCSHS